MTSTVDSVRVGSTAPVSVPTSIFVRIENETTGDHSLYLRLQKFSAVSNLTLLARGEEIMPKLDELLSNFYCRRPVGTILEKHLAPIKNNENATTISLNTTVLLDSLINMIEEAVSLVKQISDFLSDILVTSCKVPGSYSDVLLEMFCTFMYKLTALDQIHQKKKSLKEDLQKLQTLLTHTDLANLKPQIDKCNKWLKEDTPSLNQVLYDLRAKSKSQMEFSTFTKIMWSYLSKMLPVKSSLAEILTEKGFVKPNLHFAHLITLIFFIKNKPADIINPQTSEQIKNYFEEIPYIPLYHELWLDTKQCIGYIDIFRSSSFMPRPPDPSRLLPKLRDNFSLISGQIAHYVSTQSLNQEDCAPFVQLITNAFSLINYTKAILRQSYCKNLANPPDKPADKGPYERAIRNGFTDQDTSTMLQLFALCRELHDLLFNNSTKIYTYLSISIQAQFQEFIKHKLAKCYNHMQRDKEKLGDIIDEMRYVAGDFERHEKISMKEKVNRTEAYKHKIPMKNRTTPQLIELIRIQIQHLINPESEFMVKGSKFLGAAMAFRQKEDDMLKAFIDNSRQWNDLIAFNQSLTEAVDQSDFYFKEVQLDSMGVYQIPSKASLPFKLCDFVLQDANKPELTELIFYPLSIYDDAAFVAINRHHNQLMYSEIQAEGKQTLEILQALISEFTFNTFRTFSSCRQMPDKMIETLKSGKNTFQVSKTYRLRTFITQNQFYFLGKNINVKSFIASRIDDQLNSAVAQLYELSKSIGILSSLAVMHGLDALRDTHRLLIEYGLPLMPFPNIERTGKMDNHPLSFTTNYFIRTISHIFKNLVPRYLLAINPHRFIPPKKRDLPAEALGRGQLGRILQKANEGSIAFATMTHFNFFIRQCSEGTLSLLFDLVRKQITSLFNHFVKAYSEIKPRIQRIKDSVYGTPIEQSFARYETAYSFLLENSLVHDCFKAMMSIGNLFIVIEMLDEAMTIRRFSLSHALSVLRSYDEKGVERDEINNLFDPQFREGIAHIKAQKPDIAEKASGLLLMHSFNILTDLMMKEKSLFEEVSLIPGQPRLPPLQTMTGFAVIWSVLEFIFIQQEVIKPLPKPNQPPPEPAGFSKYGNGVAVGAGIISLFTEQVPLYRAVSIGTKIERAASIDDDIEIPKMIESHIGVFLSFKAVYDWSIMFFGEKANDALKRYYQTHSSD